MMECLNYYMLSKEFCDMVTIAIDVMSLHVMEESENAYFRNIFLDV